MTSDSHLRLPAEWEPQEAVLLSWPHVGTDWAYMLSDVQRCFVGIVQAIAPLAHVVIVAPDTADVAQMLDGKVDMRCVHIVECPTNDTWARDFGLIATVGPDGEVTANDFKFNGWGLKFAADKDNLITRHLLASHLANPALKYRNLLSFVLEGGSIDTDGRGTLLTTSECLLSPNRNGQLTRQDIERELCSTLGVDRVLWLEHGALAGDDTDSHIDTLARFLPGDVIAYSACDRADDSHYQQLALMAGELEALRTPQGLPYRLVPLPIPCAIYDSEGQRLPATYANFLILNGSILLPVYGDEHYDRIAIDALAIAVPDYKIVPVDCRALIEQHGSLHCVTMQLPKGVLSL